MTTLSIKKVDADQIVPSDNNDRTIKRFDDLKLTKAIFGYQFIEFPNTFFTTEGQDISSVIFPIHGKEDETFPLKTLEHAIEERMGRPNRPGMTKIVLRNGEKVGVMSLSIYDSNLVMGRIALDDEYFVVRPTPMVTTDSGVRVHVLASVDLSCDEATDLSSCPQQHSWTETPLTYDSSSPIKVLVVYSAFVVTQLTDLIDDTTADLIALTNDSFVMSSMDLSVELAGGHPVTTEYEEDGEYCIDLANIASDSIAEIVDSRGDANIVVLILAGCGGGRTRNDLCVVNYLNFERNRFQHEIGHVFQAQHAGDPSEPASRRGYIHLNEWQTIMGDNGDSSVDRLNIWARPEITIDGTTIDTAGRNAAEYVIKHAGDVQQRYPAILPRPPEG